MVQTLGCQSVLVPALPSPYGDREVAGASGVAVVEILAYPTCMPVSDSESSLPAACVGAGLASTPF